MEAFSHLSIPKTQLWGTERSASRAEQNTKWLVIASTPNSAIQGRREIDLLALAKEGFHVP